MTEKKLRWISSRKHNPAVKYFYGNPVHTNPWTQCYSGSKCKTHPTCTFSSYNSNYQFNYLLNPLANQHLPEELFELHPRLALGALPHVQHPLCCPLRLESTLSSSLHLFLAPRGFDKDHILQYSVRNTDKIMVGKKKKGKNSAFNGTCNSHQWDYWCYGLLPFTARYAAGRDAPGTSMMYVYLSPVCMHLGGNQCNHHKTNECR